MGIRYNGIAGGKWEKAVAVDSLCTASARVWRGRGGGGGTWAAAYKVGKGEGARGI